MQLQQHVYNVYGETVYNVYGFRARKEKGADIYYSAASIATFWEQNVRLGVTGDTMKKKSTIDICLTIMNGVSCLPDVELIIAEAEELHGPDS